MHHVQWLTINGFVLPRLVTNNSFVVFNTNSPWVIPSGGAFFVVSESSPRLPFTSPRRRPGSRQALSRIVLGRLQRDTGFRRYDEEEGPGSRQTLSRIVLGRLQRDTGFRRYDEEGPV